METEALFDKYLSKTNTSANAPLIVAVAGSDSNAAAASINARMHAGWTTVPLWSVTYRTSAGRCAVGSALPVRCLRPLLRAIRPTVHARETSRRGRESSICSTGGSCPTRSDKDGAASNRHAVP